MNKRKGTIIAILLILFLGTGSFVFANPSEKELDKGNSNNRNTTNSNSEKKENKKESGITIDNDSEINDDDQDDSDSMGVLAPVLETTTYQGNRNHYGSGNITSSNNVVDSNKPGNDNTVSTDHNYDNAYKAVDEANASMTEENYQKALEIVNQLPDGPKKDELLEQLDVIHKLIQISSMLNELKVMVQSASGKSDIQKAQEFLEKNDLEKKIQSLPNSEKKQAFMNELNQILNILNDNDAPSVTGIRNGEVINHNLNVKVTDNLETSILLNDQEMSLEELNGDLAEGEYDLVVIDQSFNETNLHFIVDKTAPVISGILNQALYNASDIVKIQVEDAHGFVYHFERNGKAEEYTLGQSILEDGEYSFYAYDEAGNVSELYGFTIDRVAPTASVSYNITDRTNQDVIGTLINPSEEITVLNNGGSLSYTFAENGEFVFEISDKAGNKTEIVANVKNIDKDAPLVKDFGILNYSRVGTNQKLSVASYKDVIWAYTVFEEKLGTAPTMKFYDQEVNSQFSEEYSTDGKYVYIASYEVPLDVEEGEVLIAVSNYADDLGNVGSVLSNQSIISSEYASVYVLNTPGFIFQNKGYFNQKEILIKDPDYDYMMVRSITPPMMKKVEENHFTIPDGASVFMFIVYYKDGSSVPFTMTYDGFSPQINGTGVQENDTLNITDGGSYQEVNLSVYDQYLDHVIVSKTVNGVTTEDKFEFTDLYATKDLHYDESGDYNIVAYDRAGNETSIQFTIQ